MELDTLMEELSRELELDAPLESEVPNVYTLPLDETIAVIVSKTPEGLLLTCTLAPAPHLHREDFFEELLHANLFGQGTEQAVLGLTDDGNTVTLSHHIKEELSYSTFSDILEDFISSVDFWRGEALSVENTPP